MFPGMERPYARKSAEQADRQPAGRDIWSSLRCKNGQVIPVKVTSTSYLQEDQHYQVLFHYRPFRTTALNELNLFLDTEGTFFSICLKLCKIA